MQFRITGFVNDSNKYSSKLFMAMCVCKVVNMLLQIFIFTCTIGKSLNKKMVFNPFSLSLLKFSTNLKGFNKCFVTFSYLGAGVTNSDFRS